MHASAETAQVSIPTFPANPAPATVPALPMEDYDTEMSIESVLDPQPLSPEPFTKLATTEANGVSTSFAPGDRNLALVDNKLSSSGVPSKPNPPLPSPPSNTVRSKSSLANAVNITFVPKVPSPLSQASTPRPSDADDDDPIDLSMPGDDDPDFSRRPTPRLPTVINHSSVNTIQSKPSLANAANVKIVPKMPLPLPQASTLSNDNNQPVNLNLPGNDNHDCNRRSTSRLPAVNSYGSAVNSWQKPASIAAAKKFRLKLIPPKSTSITSPSPSNLTARPVPKNIPETSQDTSIPVIPLPQSDTSAPKNTPPSPVASSSKVLIEDLEGKNKPEKSKLFSDSGSMDPVLEEMDTLLQEVREDTHIILTILSQPGISTNRTKWLTIEKLIVDIESNREFFKENSVDGYHPEKGDVLSDAEKAVLQYYECRKQWVKPLPGSGKGTENPADDCPG